jgi:hypothetical protein
MLRRIEQQLQQTLQQQQQGRGLGPAGKRQRLEDGYQQQLLQPDGHTGQQQDRADTCDQLAEMLLNAHDAAMQQPGGVDLEWRLAFLQLLQQTAALHAPLLRLLLASMVGSGGEYEPQQVRLVGHMIMLKVPGRCVRQLRLTTTMFSCPFPWRKSYPAACDVWFFVLSRSPANIQPSSVPSYFCHC